ncbi:siderophore ABC transporter substrate-binding protein [Bartonella sp. M0280]|uniref:siderophore ABC transporter substrate-binding protein n=1 Tax=Bartonella apihabitans TaxID=2750929 RepID=UPI0018DAFD2A|nr:siderophore ABC transporter substrate-binding protein [Bartonella apihabitans]MBI0166435.1 siderophore ABC transporter substrate-binding protein [Bartonella apihabitans]
MINRRNTLAALLFGALASVLSFQSPASADVVIKHAAGETSIPDSPKRVVVFDLATLDNMNRLKIDNIVGVPEGIKPKYLEQYNDAKYTKVGTLFEPNYETVASLKPDLIIIADRSASKFNDLAKIAPTIDLSVNNKQYLADVDRNVTILGQIFNKQKEAKDEIDSLNNKLEEVKKLAADKGTGLLVMTTGGKISAFGPGSRFGLLHSGFGVKPANDKLEVGNHGQMISPEFILETNPDWLFVIDRDAAIGREGESAAKLLDNALINKTKAAENKHIVYLDPQNWYLIGGGLSGLHETADQLDDVFSKAK